MLLSLCSHSMLLALCSHSVGFKTLKILHQQGTLPMALTSNANLPYSIHLQNSSQTTSCSLLHKSSINSFQYHMTTGMCTLHNSTCFAIMCTEFVRFFNHYSCMCQANKHYNRNQRPWSNYFHIGNQMFGGKCCYGVSCVNVISSVSVIITSTTTHQGNQWKLENGAMNTVYSENYVFCVFWCAQ